MSTSKITPEDNVNYEEVIKHTLQVTSKGNLNIPSYFLTMLEMFKASWLSVNDDEEENCNSTFVGGNINLSLICALLFTTFITLMYSEPFRLDDENDGLTIDLFNGYLSTIQPIILSKDDIHDIFDASYLISVAGTLFGTMTAVFFMLAANEAGNDAKTFVLLRYIGVPVVSTPYYFFSIGIISWAFGGMVQLFLVPQTQAGWIIKIVVLFSMILHMLVIVFPRMIQGVFAGRVEEDANPPVYRSEQVINRALAEFFKDPYSSGDLSLKTFLKSLTKMTHRGYRPSLQVITRLVATSMYYKKLAALTGLSVDEIRDTLKEK